MLYTLTPEEADAYDHNEEEWDRIKRDLLPRLQAEADESGDTIEIYHPDDFMIRAIYPRPDDEA